MDAIAACVGGVSRAGDFIWCVAQNMGRLLAYVLYRWDVCMRETVIVGLVDAGD